jgi:hypothetical protein
MSGRFGANRGTEVGRRSEKVGIDLSEALKQATEIVSKATFRICSPCSPILG